MVTTQHSAPQAGPPQPGVRATSVAQQQAWHAGTPAPHEEIRPGLWAVCMPMFGPGMPWSIGYAFIDHDSVHIVDPGLGSPENLARWESFLGEQGKTLQDIESIIVTHSHFDHLGLAGLMRERSGATLLMSEVEASVQVGTTITTVHEKQAVADRLDRWGVPAEVREAQLAEFANYPQQEPTIPDRTFTDGEIINVGGHDLTALLTPGHTDGHACFVAEGAGVILTGDHVLPEINPGLGLGTLGGGDPLNDYFSALKRIGSFDHCEVLPGHEWRFTGLAVRTAEIATHHLKRTRAIANLLPELGDATIWHIASRSPWSRGWANMSGFHLHSGLAQTEMHVASIRSGRAETWLAGDWPPPS